MSTTLTPPPPSAASDRTPDAPPPSGGSRVVAIIVIVLGGLVLLGAMTSAAIATFASASVSTSTRTLDAAGVDIVRNTAQELGMKVLTLQTVAGHDALAIQKRLPSSLFFVPSRDGISHNPREYTSPEALERGYKVLTEILWRMVIAP